MSRDKKGRFLPGQSGNPGGYRPGKLRADQFREAIAQYVPEIIDHLMAQVRAGDTNAARVLLDRSLPALRAEAKAVNLPDLLAAQTLTDKAMMIIDAIAKGVITPQEGGEMLGALKGANEIREFEELERRLASIEETKE